MFIETANQWAGPRCKSTIRNDRWAVMFTMLEGVSETPSAFVHGRPSHRWMAVKTEGNATLRDLSQRVRVPPEFSEKVYDILTPGATIVVTDAPALPALTPDHRVRLMEAGK